MIALALSGVLDFLGYSAYPLIGIGSLGIAMGSFRMYRKIRLKRRMAERGALY